MDSSGFTNFAICGNDDMYNTLYNLSVCRTRSDNNIFKINGYFYGCGLLQMASYRKLL